MDSLPLIAGAFLVSTVAVVFGGIRLTVVADRLADRTGLGEALAGTLLLGAATSLSGLMTSVSAAWSGLPALAVSNAAGGIAGQTVFLIIADMLYRRANLEHAAASLPNLLQCATLMACLTVVMIGVSAPEISVFGIHPASAMAFVTYLTGLRLAQSSRDQPGWLPQETRLTRRDVPDEASGDYSLTRLWGEFAALAVLTGGSGLLLGSAADGLVTYYDVSEALLGTFGTALVTSLPELVTTITAVRRGALTLAVAGILGGNAFDTIFIAASDIAYRDGSIYAAMTTQQSFLIGITLFMTASIMLGLLRRERTGIGRNGFESIFVLGAYITAIVYLTLTA